ncbi:MAG: RNA polymerase, partial [Pararhodobacter sp.]|nr:RNA polymerase [Pararhodobacter sp.]
RPGPFQIKAAIADCQMADPAPDWPQIAALYGALLRFEPTPVVQLNAAVAIAEAGDPARGLALVEALVDLADYQPFHAARAALLAKTGNTPAAIDAYRHAIAIAPTRAEALFLTARMDDLCALRDAP